MAAVVVAARRQNRVLEEAEDVMEHLAPKESRLREGLVNKKIAAAGPGGGSLGTPCTPKPLSP